MNRQEQQQIAETILQQLGGNRFIAMTGAHSFVADSGALIFALPKQRKVRIQLTGMDLYDMTLFRLRKQNGCIDVETVAESSGLYFDQIQPEFTRITGLYTHL